MKRFLAFCLLFRSFPIDKRATYHWMKEKVYRPEFEGVELHHLYRALDHLVRGKESVEEALFARNRDLFSLGVDLVLFDTTLVHFEGQGPEGLAAFGRPGNYPDCVKVLLGLVMTGDGFPIAHHLFPGNTADINAFQVAFKGLKQRFSLRRVIIVADRGVVSEGVIEGLEKEEMGYILGMRLRKNNEVRKEVLSRPGRYHEVEDNLEVKEVWVGGRRYVVCHNGEEEERDRRRREEIIERAREDLKKKGARYDGKWVLRSNTDLAAAGVAQAYKGLWRIEHAFRELKSGLEIRPVFLHTEDHVRGHIVVCFLALVMEAAPQRLLKKQGANGSYRDVLNDLEEVRAVRLKANGKSWLVRTELPLKAFQAFKAVGLRPPAHVQPLS